MPSNRIQVVRPDQVTDEMVDSCLDLWIKNKSAFEGIEFDRLSIRKTIEQTAGSGIVIKHGTGIAGAVHHPFPWNHNISVGSVVFWTFKEHRDIQVIDCLVKLLFEVVRCDIVNCSSHFPEHRIGRHYEKMGFKQCEMQWILSKDVAMKTLKW